MYRVHLVSQEKLDQMESLDSRYCPMHLLYCKDQVDGRRIEHYCFFLS